MAQYLSILLYVVGLVAGLWLAGGTIWVNLETSLFASGVQREAKLTPLDCPKLLSATETGVVRTKFSNETERPLNFVVRANISNGYLTLIRQERATLRLQPGETQELAWEVAAADAVYGRVIMVRVNVLRNLSNPARDATCGILLIRSPLTGGQAVALALLLTVGGMGGGLALWIWSKRPLTGRAREMTWIAGWLALLVMMLVAAGLLRYWMIGVLLLAFMLLMAGVLLERWGHLKSVTSVQ
ncbi:MAG: hypothetical protein IPM39_06730 [Chloroflexi bacterium]|nr:hypothetical protein [Chloroflexota bacterium]